MSCCDNATSQLFDSNFEFWEVGYHNQEHKNLGRLNLIHTTKLHWINFLFNVLQLNHDLLYMFFLYICVTNTRSMTVYHTFYITRRRQCMMFTDNSQLVQISFIKFDTAYMIYVWFMLFYLFKFSICLYGE